MNLIVAYSKKNHGIGNNNSLPWNLKNELKYFKKITSTNKNNLENVIVMGRNTWNSLPKKPLPNRINVVITKTPIPNVITYQNLENFYKDYKDKEIYIIGGKMLYMDALNKEYIKKIYITEIYKEFECDTFFPVISNEFKLIDVSEFQEENNIYYRNLILEKKPDMKNMWVNKEETEYLNLLKKILNEGERVQSRNAITYRIFSNMITYDLQDTFPILTTKRVYWKGIVEELLWFISGSTNSNKLSEKNVKIWEPNSSREFLDSRGLQKYEIGDIGPTYGFAFRHFGEEYNGMNSKYNGFDQIEYLINEIKNNPNSRRLIIDLWNPCDFSKTALPPCVFMYQFFVQGDKLSCQLYQRSADSFPANHWNTTSCALFIHIIAHICNLKPYKLHHITGDTHIYEIHKEQVEKQLLRNPKPFPKLIINRKVDEINNFKFEDFSLVDYNPDKGIKASIVA
jgi:dihydrofolate reductase / thymidylate synthase